MNTDHFPLIAEVKLKLKGRHRESKEAESWQTPEKPETVEEIDDFYREIIKEYTELSAMQDSVNNKVEYLNHTLYFSKSCHATHL